MGLDPLIEAAICVSGGVTAAGAVPTTLSWSACLYLSCSTRVLLMHSRLALATLTTWMRIVSGHISGCNLPHYDDLLHPATMHVPACWACVIKAKTLKLKGALAGVCPVQGRTQP